MFFIFIKACEKYKFSYALSSIGGLKIVLRPNNTFCNIEVNIQNCYHNYFSAFLKAIKFMRTYRKGCVC
jgi:hypothetical protein